MRRFMTATALLIIIYTLSVELPGLKARAQSTEIVEQVWKNQETTKDVIDRIGRDERAAERSQNQMDKFQSKFEAIGERLSALEQMGRTNNELLMGAILSLVALILERALSWKKERAARS